MADRRPSADLRTGRRDCADRPTTWLRPPSGGGTISTLENTPYLPLPLAQTTIHFGKLELPAAQARVMSNAAIDAMLVASGTSRLTAERIGEVEREGADSGRARSPRQSRR